VFGRDNGRFIQIKLTKISYIGTLLKAWFMHDSGLFQGQV